MRVFYKWFISAWLKFWFFWLYWGYLSTEFRFKADFRVFSLHFALLLSCPKYHWKHPNRANLENIPFWFEILGMDFKSLKLKIWKNYKLQKIKFSNIKGIGGTKYISFEDRHWHNECFTCNQCRSSLVGRGFLTEGMDILCPECGKN